MEAASEDPCIIRSLRGHKESISALAFHPGCRYVASAGMDNLVLLWDLFGQAPMHKFAGHKVSVVVMRRVKYMLSSFRPAVTCWLQSPKTKP